MAAGSIGRCHRHSILSTDVHARISHMCGNHGASPTLHTNHQPRMNSSRRSLGSDKTQVGSNKPVLVRKAHNTEMSNLRGSAGRFHYSGNFWNHPMPNDQMFGKRSYNMRLSNVQSTNRSHLHRACLAAWPPCSQVTHPCSARDSKRGHLSMASPFHDHAVGITHPSMASQVSSQQEQHSISVNQSFQRLDF